MRHGFLIAYISLMWLLIILGGYILIKVVAVIEFDNLLIESAIKAIIAIGMVVIWIMIMVIIKNVYVRRVINA